MVSTPDPPDPYETAQAQAGMNRDTAITQSQLNMVDQYNPWGSVKYSQNGFNTFVDSNGKTVKTPRYTQTTSYTPEQQAIFDRTTEAQTNISQLAVDQSAALQDRLSKPFEFNNQSAADWAYDLASSRILPQQEKNRQSLEAQLVNRGIRPGSAAYNSEMERLTNANTDQLNQLALNGRQMAYNEARDQYTLPINTITALLSGSQVANPGSASPATPQTSVGGVDYTGLVNNAYQAELAQSQSMMGGLFGLGAAGLGLFSDERLKEDVERVGETDDGQPIYTYRYKSGGPTQMGVMAQETPEKARKKDPITGFWMVDYGKVH